MLYVARFRFFIFSLTPFGVLAGPLTLSNSARGGQGEGLERWRPLRGASPGRVFVFFIQNFLARPRAMFGRQQKRPW